MKQIIGSDSHTFAYAFPGSMLFVVFCIGRLYILFQNSSTENNITITSNERHEVSDHRSFDCLFNSLCGAHRRDIKIRITGPLWGEFTGDRWSLLTKGQ